MCVSPKVLPSVLVLHSLLNHTVLNCFLTSLLVRACFSVPVSLTFLDHSTFSLNSVKLQSLTESINKSIGTESDMDIRSKLQKSIAHQNISYLAVVVSLLFLFWLSY